MAARRRPPPPRTAAAGASCTPRTRGRVYEPSVARAAVCAGANDGMQRIVLWLRAMNSDALSRREEEGGCDERRTGQSPRAAKTGAFLASKYPADRKKARVNVSSWRSRSPAASPKHRRSAARPEGQIGDHGPVVRRERGRDSR